MPRPVFAYALIWILFLAVPAAREVVVAQVRRLFGRRAGRYVACGWACGALLVAVDAVLLVKSGELAMTDAWRPAAGAVAVAVFYAACVAATEEMIVRGLLLTRLRQVTGDAAAVAVTAVVFAAMHIGRSDLGVSSLLEYLADGVLLGWLAIVTGSIWAGAAFHMAKNLGVILCFGTSRHLLTPLLATPPGIAPDPARVALADLGAYVVAVSAAVAVFWSMVRAKS